MRARKTGQLASRLARPPLPIDAGVKIEVLHSSWGADKDVFAAGAHELGKPAKKLLRLIAGAEAAGALTVLEATTAERKLLDGFVQSQKAGEAAYKQALTKGTWQHGNLTNFVLSREDRVAYSDTLEESHEDKLDPDTRALFLTQAEQAAAALAETPVPK